jgi:RNA polymerase sigma-70 factor (ECF subfamily)
LYSGRIDKVVPLEAALMRFLRCNWREERGMSDLRQDIYVRIFESASRGLIDRAPAMPRSC